MLTIYTPDTSTACILYNGDPRCEACEDSRGSIMWTLVVVVGLYFVGALIQGELHHVAASVIQYFAMMPTFVNIVAVYAFANLQDLSWGTKGKLAAGTGQGGFKERKKGRGSIANFIEREKIARDEEKARAKQAKAVSSQFETFRSLILCTWMLTNFWWANLWFYEDPAGFCYLNYVGWFIIVVALLKLVGSIIFVGIRSCRGFGERLGICSRPYKYEVGVETPVVPKKSIFSGNVSSPPVPVSASRGDDEQQQSQGSAVVEQ